MVFSHLTKCGNLLHKIGYSTRENSQMLNHDIFCSKDIFRINMRSSKLELSIIYMVLRFSIDFKRNGYVLCEVQPASYLVSI